MTTGDPLMNNVYGDNPPWSVDHTANEGLAEKDATIAELVAALADVTAELRMEITTQKLWRGRLAPVHRAEDLLRRLK